MNIVNFIYESKFFLMFAAGLLLLTILTFLAFRAVDLRNISSSAKNEMNDITLIESIELSNQWEKIDLTNVSFPLKEINYISIVVNPPYTVLVGKNKGIKAPNGECFLPEVAVEDFEGNRCDLKFAGIRGEHTAYFWDISETRCFSEPRKYTTLLVKSPSNFKAKEILWSGFDVKDMK